MKKPLRDYWDGGRPVALYERVTLRYTDYADHDRQKTLTLEGPEFVRRFLMQIVPKGLMLVRHYGFLANRCRRRKLDRVRAALAVVDEPTPREERSSPPDDWACRDCGQGRLMVRRCLPAVWLRRVRPSG